MAAITLLSTLAFGAAFTLLLLGLVLLKAGAWPRRTGATPHCAGCGYILHGLSLSAADARCPECGRSLAPPLGVVIGHRHRRGGLTITGASLLLVGLAAAVIFSRTDFRTIDWYAYKPTAWVIRDLGSSSPAVSNRAWAELTARLKANRLSPGQQSDLDDAATRLFAASMSPRVIEYVLARFASLRPAHQARVVGRLLTDLTTGSGAAADDAGRRLARVLAVSPLTSPPHDQVAAFALAAQAARKDGRGLDWLMDYLAGRDASGKLSAEQREQFRANCFLPTLEVRAKVAAGNHVPFRIRFDGRGPGDLWSARQQFLGTQLDDQPPRNDGGDPITTSFGERDLPGFFNVREPGRHTLRATVQVSLHDRSAAKSTPPLWSRRLTISAPFEVLPKGARRVEWIEDPALGERIRQCITVRDVSASDTSFSAFFAAIVINPPPPIDLAFEVIARTPAGEFPINKFDAPAGKTKITTLSARDFPPGAHVGKVDVVLRSSEEVARSTTYLTKGWKGEIVFRDVPVRATE